MLEGSSGYSKGILVTGSIKKKEAITYTPGVSNITISKGQYLNGDQIILGDADLKSENIKSGVEIFGISGSIKDNSGQTLTANNVVQSGNNALISIPDGYYDNNSLVSISVQALANNVPAVYDYLYPISRTVEKTSVVRDGGAWLMTYGKMAILNFYLEIAEDIPSWTSKEILILTDNPSAHYKGTCLRQNSGLSDVIEASPNSNTIKLATKSNSMSKGEWIWGQFIFTIN